VGEISLRSLIAIQRLGLCRFGVPLCPAPPPAKLRDYVLALAIQFARDVAACTLRAATSLPDPLRGSAPSTGHLEPPDKSADTTRAGRQRHCGFSLRPASLCSAAKPQRLWLCLWRLHFATMPPLRAVVSRGHIASITRSITSIRLATQRLELPDGPRRRCLHEGHHYGAAVKRTVCHHLWQG